MPSLNIERNDAVDPLVEDSADLSGEPLINKQIRSALERIARRDHQDILDILRSQFPKLAISVRVRIGANLSKENMLNEAGAEIDQWTSSSKNRFLF